MPKVHAAVIKLSNGRIGASMGGGRSVLVITTTGRTSGKTREITAIAMDHPDGWIVTNSNGGHSEQPGWYYNLQADPSASVRAGSETHAVTARELDGAERDEWWEKFVAEYTEYTGFQEVAHRQIAMLVLTRT